MTLDAARVLRALLNAPDAPYYGGELMITPELPTYGMKSGLLYPILNRLAEAGYVRIWQEEPNPATRKRPPRRYVELTTDGATRARTELAELAEQLTPPSEATAAPPRSPTRPTAPTIPAQRARRPSHDRPAV